MPLDDRHPAIAVVVVGIGGNVLLVFGDLLADLGRRQPLGHPSPLPNSASRNLREVLGASMTPYHGHKSQQCRTEGDIARNG
jgi:hypothetical protein